MSSRKFWGPGQLNLRMLVRCHFRGRCWIFVILPLTTSSMSWRFCRRECNERPTWSGATIRNYKIVSSQLSSLWRTRQDRTNCRTRIHFNILHQSSCRAVIIAIYQRTSGVIVRYRTAAAKLAIANSQSNNFCHNGIDRGGAILCIRDQTNHFTFQFWLVSPKSKPICGKAVQHNMPGVH